MRTVLRLLSLIAALPASLAYAQEAPPPAPAPYTAAPVAQPAPAPAPAPVPAPVPVQPAPAAPYAPPPGQAYPYAQPVYPYPYPPPVDTAERRAVLGELANVDAQIASVQAERNRHGLGGPIAMMATGFGTSIVFSIVAIVQWQIAEDIEQKTFFNSEYDYDDYDLNDDGVINGEDEDRARRGARTLGVLSILGAGVGVGGSVFLAKRLAARRKFNPNLESLRARRLQLLRHLQYGGMLGNGGMRLSLSGRF